jgi:tRNA-dihydrouridine synthase A
MMDWTDRHCRFFHRLIAPKARLYTEMITTGAILHGDLHRLLDFNAAEHPLALQLGGSEPADLARAAAIGAQWGYDEINLNCGCPSERVQRGAFGACLMREPQLVAEGIRAMMDAVSLPVTVKHRIGVDDQNEYSFVRDFVGALFDAGCRVFFVHARGAILKGLSPKENREIPPLKMSVVGQLKQDFPEAVIVANGGITSLSQALSLLAQSTASGDAPLLPLDGLMLGRAAYHNPWLLRDLSVALFESPSDPVPMQQIVKGPRDRSDILPALQQYFETEQSKGVPARQMTRHWHGLFHGQPGARQWRRDICEGGEGPLALYERLNSGRLSATMTTSFADAVVHPSAQQS